MSGLSAFAYAVADLFFAPDPAAVPAPAVAAPSAASVRRERKRYAWRCLQLGLEAFRGYDARRAYDTFHEAFVAFQQNGARKAASLTQKTIGLVAEKIETPAKVRATYTNARAMLQQAGLHDEEARALFLHADFEARQAAYASAYPLYEESLSLSRSIGYVVGEVECLCRYGWTLKQGGKNEDAQQRILEARTIAQERGAEALVGRVTTWTEKLAEHDAAALKSGTATATPVAAGAGSTEREWQPIQEGKHGADEPPPARSTATVQPRRKAAPPPQRSAPPAVKKRAGARR